MKVQDRSSLEPPLEYNQDQTFLTDRLHTTFLRNLGVTKIIRSFGLVTEGRTRTEISMSSTSQSSYKSSYKSF